jgi:site-specific DNA recombinase
MQENARQGFWNGPKAPYGYAVVDAEQRGAKTKKRLAIDPVEAEVVRLMFKLFREGDGRSGPMGVKSVTSWLNKHGYRTWVGARWGIGPLHQILTRATCKGEHRFNRKIWKTREAKTEADQIGVPVDPIIDATTFDAVQAMLKAKNPRVLPSRVVTGPILLTGLATCASCNEHDPAHRKVRPLPLLHLRDLRPAGQRRVQGALNPHGQARPPRDRASRGSPANA